MRYTTSTVLAAATLTFTTLTHAKTDLSGCTSTDVSSPAGASVAWYVPGTYELCDFLDCGGGRAPPKTTVPGCPQYSGTATYSPSYLAGYGPDATPAPYSEVSSAAATTEMATAEPAVTSGAESASMMTSSSFDWDAAETDTALSSWDLYTDTTAGAPTAAATTAAAGVTTAPGSGGESLLTIQTSMPPTTSYSNGTMATGAPTGNGTASNGTMGSPSVSSGVPVSEGGAAGMAKAWAGSAGVMVGFGMLVAAL